MKLIEKPWRYGTYLAYDEVEDVFVPQEKGVRVLPAPFFYDKKLYFELKATYAPGEKQTFPNGGYEVVDMSGGLRSYDLDQVIIHPSILKHKKMLEKMARKAEKKQKQRDKTLRKLKKESKIKHGRRGRPALDPVVKAARDAEKVARASRSGGKRGRPKSTLLSTPKVEKPAGGKRGRPALTPEAIAQRASVKAATKARSGGMRGRPKTKR